MIHGNGSHMCTMLPHPPIGILSLDKIFSGALDNAVGSG